MEKKDNYNRLEGLITPFLIGEEQQISDIVYSCIDNSPISKNYSPETVKSLKKLYTPERILGRILRDKKQGYEIWSARHEERLRWVMGLGKNQKEKELEIEMFYGLNSIEGAKGARQLLLKAKQELIRTQYKYLVGKVLKPAQRFIKKMGNLNGNVHISKLETVKEIDPDTNAEFTFQIVRYRYTLSN